MCDNKEKEQDHADRSESERQVQGGEEPQGYVGLQLSNPRQAQSPQSAVAKHERRGGDLQYQVAGRQVYRRSPAGSR